MKSVIEDNSHWVRVLGAFIRLTPIWFDCLSIWLLNIYGMLSLWSLSYYLNLLHFYDYIPSFVCVLVFVSVNWVNRWRWRWLLDDYDLSMYSLCPVKASRVLNLSDSSSVRDIIECLNLSCMDVHYIYYIWWKKTKIDLDFCFSYKKIQCHIFNVCH